jgi:hypothetical protein
MASTTVSRWTWASPPPISDFQKSHLTLIPNHRHIFGHPIPTEGRWPTSSTWGGLRWTRRVRSTRVPDADDACGPGTRRGCQAGGGNSVGDGEKKSAHAAQGLPRPSDDLRCYRRSASLTVSGPPDDEFKGRANSCRSGSGPFGAYALPDVFELWWPSVFTSVSAFNEVFDTGKAPHSIH